MFVFLDVGKHELYVVNGETVPREVERMKRRSMFESLLESDDETS